MLVSIEESTNEAPTSTKKTDTAVEEEEVEDEDEEENEDDEEEEDEEEEDEEEGETDASTAFVSLEIMKFVNGLLSREFLDEAQACLLNELLNENGTLLFAAYSGE